MDVAWVFLGMILLVLLFLFVINDSSSIASLTPPIRQKLPDEPIPVPSRDIQIDIDTAEKIASEANLVQYYPEASPVILVDNEKKKIGECPVSKPLSKDLPMVDVPRCIALRSGGPLEAKDQFRLPPVTQEIMA